MNGAQHGRRCCLSNEMSIWLVIHGPTERHVASNAACVCVWTVNCERSLTTVTAAGAGDVGNDDDAMMTINDVGLWCV